MLAIATVIFFIVMMQFKCSGKKQNERLPPPGETYWVSANSSRQVWWILLLRIIAIKTVKIVDNKATIQFNSYLAESTLINEDSGTVFYWMVLCYLCWL